MYKVQEHHWPYSARLLKSQKQRAKQSHCVSMVKRWGWGGTSLLISSLKYSKRSMHFRPWKTSQPSHDPSSPWDVSPAAFQHLGHQSSSLFPAIETKAQQTVANPPNVISNISLVLSESRLNLSSSYFPNYRRQCLDRNNYEFYWSGLPKHWKQKDLK